MTLHDRIGAVDLMGTRAVRQAHFLRSEAHRAAELRFLGALLDRIGELSRGLPETLHLPGRTVVDLCVRR